MRKIHKTKLTELVTTLSEACGQLDKCDDRQRINLCGEIQEFVEVVFEYATSVLRPESKIIPLLQSLYEVLFQVAQGDRSVNQLHKLVHHVVTEVHNLKPDKTEVVFFCYKASMSDALESVYLAAKEDPSCDAFFVPIPYYDRNPDRSLGQMHFEGIGFYSDKFELTDWRKYDVETRRPDAIFIMNPYDEGNHVTSVHPDFYSKRLKNFTDNLVYIEYGLPYWLYNHPEDVPLEEYRKNGNVLPAHLHCNYVVDYSRELEVSHKRTLTAFDELTKHFGISEKDIENRFVAMGSPKFDKVVQTKREDCDLPEEWNARIAGKKVVLLNSSLAEFLKASGPRRNKNGEPAKAGCWYFEKLQSILTAFAEREDVMLWWRPHPLLESTIRSMRNSLYQEYQDIVQKFVDYGKEIFDNTEDLHRAIAWSDAMISDESSLLLLYMATGKPFYIPAITKILDAAQYDDAEDFRNPLWSRLEFMKTNKGANIGFWNCCIWWDVFLEENRGWNIHYNNFTKRFLDFVVHREKYPEAEEYRQLQLQMIQDFVVNSNGTAGQKIYEFIKQKTME